MALDDLGRLPAPDAQTTPSVPAPGQSLVQIPMTADDVGEWWKRIERSRQRVKTRETAWDTLLKAYLPIVTASGEPEAINTNAHFRNIHTKIAQLFFKSPELVLTAGGPLQDPIIGPDGQPVTAEDAVIIKQQVLAKLLGTDGIDGSLLIDELLFDVLAWAGIGASKIGYRNAVQTVQQPIMESQPVLGTMLGTQTTMMPKMDLQTGQPMTQPVEVPIFEEWYWERFSPKKLLLPDDLHSSRFDQHASWLGMEFFMPIRDAKRQFHLPPDFAASSMDDDRLYSHPEDSPTRTVRDIIHGVEIWYKAAAFDDRETHPQRLRHLVLVEGLRDKPAVHRNSPDQTFDEAGKLTPDSLIGFPIHVLTIRPLADSPYPPSDSAFTNSQVKHMNTHRQQSVKLRDAQIGKYLYDTGAFSLEEIDRLKHGEVGEFIGVEAGRLSQGSDKVIVPVVKMEASRDDWRTAQAIKQDMEETLGLGGPQIGVAPETERTATEISTVESKSNTRLEKEQSRVIQFYLSGVRKFDALLQRYADEADYIEIVGQDGTRRLMAWNKNVIAGRFAYGIKPDSNLRIDAARDRQQLIAYLNLVAADPLVDRRPIHKKLAQSFGLDPQQVVLPPALPEPLPPAGPPVSKHESAKTGGRPNAPEPEGP